MPPQQTGDELAAMEMMMMQQAAMLPAMAAAMAPPATPTIPPVYTAPEIDWTEKTEQLAQAMKADASLDRARKVGRTATYITSPLLGEEEVETTSPSLLAGSENG